MAMLAARRLIAPLGRTHAPIGVLAPIGARGESRLATEHPITHDAPHGSNRYSAARAHLAHGLAPSICDIELDRAQGSWVYTKDGKDLLDFTCGIGVTNLGHCYPRVVKACQEQLTKLFHGSVAVGLSTPIISLTERLMAGILPPSHDRVMYSTTGAEAVENAIRTVRCATGKQNIIVFQGACGRAGRPRAPRSPSASAARAAHARRFVRPAAPRPARRHRRVPRAHERDARAHALQDGLRHAQLPADGRRVRRAFPV